MTGAARPLPMPDQFTRAFWDGARQGQLVIQRCGECGHYVHPPVPLCPRCLSTEVTWVPVAGRGTIYTFTVANQAFSPFFADTLPYLLVSVALDEQDDLRVLSCLVGCEPGEVRAGMPVEVVFEDVADDVTLPLFRPVQEG